MQAMNNMTQTEEQPTKLLQVQIPVELVTRLRVAAIVQARTSSQIVAELLEQNLPAVDQPDAA
jgi:tRNA G18 (ribose-2'-O)-methylase SpoU